MSVKFEAINISKINKEDRVFVSEINSKISQLLNELDILNEAPVEIMNPFSKRKVTVKSNQMIALIDWIFGMSFGPSNIMTLMAKESQRKLGCSLEKMLHYARMYIYFKSPEIYSALLD